MTSYHTDASSLWDKMMDDDSAYYRTSWTDEERNLTIQAVIDDCKNSEVCKTKIFIGHDGYTRGEPDSDLLTLVVWTKNNNQYVLRTYTAEYWWTHAGHSAADTVYHRNRDTLSLEITENTTLRWNYSMRNLGASDEDEQGGVFRPLNRRLLHSAGQIEMYLTGEIECEDAESDYEESDYEDSGFIGFWDDDYYSNEHEYTDMDDHYDEESFPSFPSLEREHPIDLENTIEDAAMFLPAPPVLVRQRAILEEPEYDIRAIATQEELAHDIRAMFDEYEPMNL